MTANKRGIITVSVIVILVAGGYFFFIRKTKKQKVMWLRDHDFTAGSIDNMMALGDDYIDAWYDSAKEGMTFFVLNGTSYNIQGGTSIRFDTGTPKAPPLAQTTVPSGGGRLSFS